MVAHVSWSVQFFDFCRLLFVLGYFSDHVFPIYLPLLWAEEGTGPEDRAGVSVFSGLAWGGLKYKVLNTENVAPKGAQGMRWVGIMRWDVTGTCDL